MADIRPVETVVGDGSECWMCKARDYMILFEAPADDAGVERVLLCYKCEAVRRFVAEQLHEREEVTPAATIWIKPVLTHRERASAIRQWEAHRAMEAARD